MWCVLHTMAHIARSAHTASCIGQCGKFFGYSQKAIFIPGPQVGCLLAAFHCNRQVSTLEVGMLHAQLVAQALLSL